MNTTQDIINQMHRVAFTKARLCKLQQRQKEKELESFAWDLSRAVDRARFHLRVELGTLRRMRAGIPHRDAYRWALKSENPSIRGIW